MRVRDWVACQDPELLLLEGEEFDAAIVGVVSCHGQEPRVVYDRELVIQVLMQHRAWRPRKRSSGSTTTSGAPTLASTRRRSSIGRIHEKGRQGHDSLAPHINTEAKVMFHN